MNRVETLLPGFGLTTTLGGLRGRYSPQTGTGGLAPYPGVEEKPIPCPGCVTDPESRMFVVSRRSVTYLEGTVLVLVVAPGRVGSRLCVSPPGSSLSVSERYKKVLADIYNIVKMVQRKKITNRRWPYFWCSRWLQVQLRELGEMHLHLHLLVPFCFVCVQFLLLCSFVADIILSRILK